MPMICSCHTEKTLLGIGSTNIPTPCSTCNQMPVCRLRCLQMFLFVFLARNKSKDLQRMRAVSKYLVGLRVPTALLIFPEGTDLSPSNHQKSLDFARKEGLAEYQYVLHPKVRANNVDCIPTWRRHGQEYALTSQCLDFHRVLHRVMAGGPRGAQSS